MKDVCRYREKREKQRGGCLCTRQQEVAEGQWGQSARVEEVPPLLEHSEELGQVRQTGFYPACTCSSRSSGKSLRFPRSKMRATSISQGCCRGRIGE